ncbi:hypothetical protein QT397_20565 [Microbulbifer sp. MKSA007]|nr:hypothetical protein QT397_20565 [Microbulbifer sp. MKSA007]
MRTIFFETDQFNLTKEHDHFINPGCFGEDFANWLKPHLENSGIEVSDIYQEDWGWEIDCSGYYLGVGGLPENDSSNLGEWRVMITKKRSFVEAIFGKNRLSRDEVIFSQLFSILNAAGFTKVRYEENA